jgi:UDP-N-acetyl-2-amino-2-deoxyglucuronate dehydrogenase
MKYAPIRLLFLGCGAAARAHSRVLRNTAGVSLLYASRDERRARELAAEFDGVGAFGSYEEALARDVDAVVVTTPTSSHAELTRAALAAGKHVVVEKPAFMHASDAVEIGEVAAKAGLRVFVAENYAYKPITRYLRNLIQREALGEIRFVTINATKYQRAEGWRADPAIAGGGPLFEGGVHWVSFAASLGLEVQSIRGYNAGEKGSTLVVLEYENGAVGTIAHSWELAAPLGGLRMSKVQGTRGAVTFESNGFAAVTTGKAPSMRLFGLRDPVGARAMWDDFLSCLRTRRQPRFTLAMAERDLRLLEEAKARHEDVLDYST